MAHPVQATGVVAAVAAEEYLVLAENARHAVDRYAPPVKDVDVVAPELVFDEESGLGTRQPHKLAGIQGRVERKVADHIGTLVVFPHLVARRGEKRKQDLFSGCSRRRRSIRGRPCSNSPSEAAWNQTYVPVPERLRRRRQVSRCPRTIFLTFALKSEAIPAPSIIR